MKQYKAKGRNLTSPKPLYEPGEEVTMVYDRRYIGTDTDYCFSSEDVNFSCDFEQGKGYVIRFIMPEHDVEIQVTAQKYHDLRSGCLAQCYVHDEYAEEGRSGRTRSDRTVLALPGVRIG